MLEVRNLKVSYINQEINKVLNYNFSFTLSPHKIHLLISPNGAGKTTLFNAIMGLIDNRGGIIKFEDHLVNCLPTNKRPFLSVFQDQNIIEHLDVETNATLGIDKKINKKAIQTTLDSLLTMYNLTGTNKKKCYQLSGGQKQILALIRCFLMVKHKPFDDFKNRLIILDEPFNGLDKTALNQTLNILNSELKMHTLFISTHNAALAIKIADQTWQITNDKLDHINIKKNTLLH